MRFLKYIKAAFTNRWNLLFFSAGLVLAVLSGSAADVVGALVLAGEIAYLGLLGTHPRFQRYVDAQEALAARTEGSATAEDTLRRILSALPAPMMQRYEALRARCMELRQLAMELKDPGRAGSPLSLEEFQLAGLDRLLWMYLRLLFTQHSLDKFLQSTQEDQIQKETEKLQARLQQVARQGSTPQAEKMRKAIEDNLETCKTRLENLSKARDTSELVKLEIDRLDGKIRSLSELAINRHEPDFISSQVDQVSASLLNTERTLSELQFATGLEKADDAVPELLRRPNLEKN